MAPIRDPARPCRPAAPGRRRRRDPHGLGKGFEDLWNEGNLVTGGYHHVNVFDQDQWQDTCSNDWDIANAIYDDPLGSGEQILNGVWAPIQESCEHGGVDEAAARAVPSIAGTLLR